MLYSPFGSFKPLSRHHPRSLTLSVHSFHPLLRSNDDVRDVQQILLPLLFRLLFLLDHQQLTGHMCICLFKPVVVPFLDFLDHHLLLFGLHRRRVRNLLRVDVSDLKDFRVVEHFASN